MLSLFRFRILRDTSRMETEIHPTNVTEPNAAENRGPSLEPLTYSVAETAQVLGVSMPTVYRLIVRHVLRPLPFLRHKRISKSQVHNLITGKAHEN